MKKLHNSHPPPYPLPSREGKIGEGVFVIPCTVKKDRVKDLLITASEEWDAFVPWKGPEEDVQFVKLPDEKRKNFLDRLSLEDGAPLIPPKTVIFPQLESLFEFEEGKIKEMIPSPTKKLLFGLRACDVKAILFVDDFFKRNFEDIYYLNRTMNKLLVLVGCKTPPRDCFCTSTKTGPFLPVPRSLGEVGKEGFDLQLVDIGKKYLVEVGSEKGKEFIGNYQDFFEEASKKDVELSKAMKKKAEEAVTLKIDFEKAIKNFCEDKISQIIYEKIAERCIYCGGCLYICPTCTCFNIFDGKKGDRGKRSRNWDACVFEGYTREASGHNPRAEKWLRTSRRYEHKLKYNYLTTGMSGCVGCGRCLATCPVNLGMSKLIQEVTK